MAQKPDYNQHVLNMAKRLAVLPVVIVRFAWGVVTRLFSTIASRSTKDDLRQSRARRELRGLPPDHDQEKQRD